MSKLNMGYVLCPKCAHGYHLERDCGVKLVQTNYGYSYPHNITIICMECRTHFDVTLRTEKRILRKPQLYYDTEIRGEQ